MTRKTDQPNRDSPDSEEAVRHPGGNPRAELWPVHRIGIVNRGDAALRCVRAIRELRASEASHIAAIALYTDPERGAPFVRLADEAISLGPALRRTHKRAPRPAYLDRARVLAALRATHADAVWPGWGFLAEDPAFVEMVESRGLIFLGPSSATMRAIGDKVAAKRLAESVGVPVAPWSSGCIDPATDADAAARAIGFPLLVKAAAGGGGRGIRVVREPAELPAALASAASEAEGAFGDGRVFLEALVQQGRHIEVQFAADRHGHYLALGLRDCSVQRRHQKIIEEAPPPGLSAGIARALRDSAVQLARTAGYTGLGTAEFLVPSDGSTFFFLEINPRLQVEHGLTEELTGLDLVQLQIRIARGEPLAEHEPVERGHAIEARVCAEDPEAEFMPAPGQVVRLDLPAGHGVRVDCGIGLQSTVPSEFDPLIARVIAHAESREQARARLVSALTEFRLVLAGGATNKGALLELLDSQRYRDARVDVAWRGVPRDCPARFAEQALLVASILGYLRERGTARLNFFAEAAGGLPQSVPPSSGQVLDFRYRNQAYRVEVRALGDWRYAVHLDGNACVASLFDQEEHACQLVAAGERFDVTYALNDGSLRVEIDGFPHLFGFDSGGQVRASAPSVVIAIDVEEGQKVAAGQRLGLLETMKIEIAFAAPIAGTVGEIRVRANERVAAGDILLVLQPQADADTAPTPQGDAARLQLPSWKDPLAILFSAENTPDLTALAAREPGEREGVVREVVGEIRRLLMGYDAGPEEEERLVALLDTRLPDPTDSRLLDTLARVRHTAVLFADTEVLFSQAPEVTPDGNLEPSNDARLRMYLRRIGIAGAGIAETYLCRLRRALSHYGINTLEPSTALKRAVLRLFAANANAAARHRVMLALLRFLQRLADAGRDFANERNLEDALAVCTRLRGQVPDALADTAADVRYAIFELPRLRARANAAAAALATSLQRIDGNASTVDLETLGRIADSPAAIVEQIARWTATEDRLRRDAALQVLVLRRYAPLLPHARAIVEKSGCRVSRLALSDGRVVLAAVAESGGLQRVWEALAAAAVGEERQPLIDVVLPCTAPLDANALRRTVHECLRKRVPDARRVVVSALQPHGQRLHLVYERDNATLKERTDLFGLHAETVRRIELARLADFSLDRLPAPESVYAFYGRSRSTAGDERIFVLAEARAAAPGPAGMLHEAAFMHVFHKAVHTLRNIRAERDQRRRLNWNRITIFVRPALVLLPRTLQRVSLELAPAIQHLGLEKVVVRLTLREEGGGEERELVVTPTAGERVTAEWRESHHGALRPANRDERRIARARRRGLIVPSEVIRLFLGTATAGASDGAYFEEFDLEEQSRAAVCVRDRAPGENRSGIVFGIISTPTEKYPLGLRRVLVVSDPTADLGALGIEECDRLVAALDLAKERGLPLEWVAVSAGARISMDTGTENLDATARVVRRIVTFTQDGGEINVLVPGINVGAQSYFDALATMLMHTRGILIMTPRASMVLTGRRALDASGAVSAEDEVGIGGFERVMGPNGQAQYYARDLAEAVEILLEHYRYTYVAPGESGPRRHASNDPPERAITAAAYQVEGDGFSTIGDVFDPSINPGRKRPFAMRPLMHALIDSDGGSLERWRRMAGAETAIVWDAHIGGHPVCLIGIESRPVPRLGYRPNDGPDQWNGATLFPQSSKKVARAVNSASGNRPVVVLANLSGFDGSPESMRKLQLEYGAEIARAVVNFDGPIFFVVVSRYHGGAYVVFSRALNENLTALALEGSYASVIGGGPAATVVFPREVDARTAADPRVVRLREALLKEGRSRAAAALREELERITATVRLEKQGEVAGEFDAIHTVQRARDVGSLDDILPANRLRPRLIQHLDACSPGRPGDGP